MQSVHTTVLLNEAIEGLNLKNNSIVVDGTFGGGGHSREICEQVKQVKIIAIDQDAEALERGNEVFKDLDCDITFHNSNFRDLEKVLEKEKVKEVDGIILDLGLSSDQLENSGRGFSFMKDEALLMTMKENPRPEDLTAEDVVNSWSEENLASIIYGYGEERYSRRIAKAIVDARKMKEIKTTFDLVKIIEDSVPSGYKRGKIHCATKTFQALRIAVNDELNALSGGLSKGFDVLKVGGRMSVISFHSLEDRIVKRFFKEQELDGKAKLITKKPTIASEEEIINNRRSRSAKLRILEKII
jgi:16S rRNA (cytosine1402-N4)-methyltransferase